MLCVRLSCVVLVDLVWFGLFGLVLFCLACVVCLVGLLVVYGVACLFVRLCCFGLF